MTRWAEKDLTGRVMKDAAMRDSSDEWEVIEFPAILPSGNPLWPEFWSFKELSALREELHLLPVVAGNVIVSHGLGLVAHLAQGLTLLKQLEGLCVLLGLQVCHACQIALLGCLDDCFLIL